MTASNSIEKIRQCFADGDVAIGTGITFSDAATVSSSAEAGYDFNLDRHRTRALRDEPVCIVRTTELVTKPFREVDRRFAYEFGEWDRSLKTWRQECWKYYSAQCEELGREPSHTMPFVYERLSRHLPWLS